MPMKPRPIEPDDVPEVLEMIRELADYERALSEVRATEHVVAAGDGEPHRLAGFALWFLTYSTWLGRHGLYLEDLYVRPKYRARGHGLALMKSLAAICVERNYGRFEWAVLDWNDPALRFRQTRSVMDHHAPGCSGGGGSAGHSGAAWLPLP
jgi:GNAT superfamily N-acetyltransferase